MSKTLKQQTAHAIVWSFADKFGQQLLNLITGIILARFFLSPEDYGLIGLIAVFNALGYILIDSGFSNALIRKKEVSQIELSSVFYFNIVIAIVVYCILFFCAPFVARFYEQPILTSLIRVITLSIPLSSLAIMQSTLLVKSLNFKFLAQSNLFAILCSGALSIFFAFQGFGVWVLVFQVLMNIVFRNIYLWLRNSWKPTWKYSRTSIKELWSYSSKLLIASTIKVIFDNIYALLIGKIYTIKQAGYYTQANKYSGLPYLTMSSAIQSVAYPVMSQVSHDQERLKHVFRKVMRISAFTFFPVLLGMAAIAEPLIHTLLSEKWQAIVPYMQVLCIGYAFLSISAINLNIFYIKGVSSKVLLFYLIHFVLIAISILIALLYDDIMALAIGWSIASILYSIILSVYAGQYYMKYSCWEQIKDIAPYLILAAIMAVGVYSLSFYIDNSAILLAAQIIIGGAFYLGASYILGSKIIRDTFDFVLKRKI